ncbi:hypothetical protein IMCC20628_02746 [Hoeflea sp. IMCC20628]|uniref:hypothetical protein n=1 Tax=Hoeflea sp. IMCC20628 TaxID=1620421 RepID=UPI00063AEC32|nr:hypothetical protein [Hoeflea sp. IMCC20628]AKI01442.1 hypothetical protein IMCC20628_02746 [Hoeflea sp. IMCC20628]
MTNDNNTPSTPATMHKDAQLAESFKLASSRHNKLQDAYSKYEEVSELHRSHLENWGGELLMAIGALEPAGNVPDDLMAMVTAFNLHSAQLQNELRSPQPLKLSFEEQIECTKSLCDEIEKPEIPVKRIHERMERKQFNSFINGLHGRTGTEDTMADSIYETDEFFVEIFNSSPSGLFIAAHYNKSNLDYHVVDVIRTPDPELQAMEMKGTA